jgi:hypothetical protein
MGACFDFWVIGFPGFLFSRSFCCPLLPGSFYCRALFYRALFYRALSLPGSFCFLAEAGYDQF